MTINIIYLFVTMIAIYYGIITYIKIKEKTILFGLLILLASLILEIQWLDLGNYFIDTTDIFRTMRDIARTVLMIIGFKLHINCFNKKRDK